MCYIGNDFWFFFSSVLKEKQSLLFISAPSRSIINTCSKQCELYTKTNISHASFKSKSEKRNEFRKQYSHRIINNHIPLDQFHIPAQAYLLFLFGLWMRLELSIILFLVNYYLLPNIQNLCYEKWKTKRIAFHRCWFFVFLLGLHWWTMNKKKIDETTWLFISFNRFPSLLLIERLCIGFILVHFEG